MKKRHRKLRKRKRHRKKGGPTGWYTYGVGGSIPPVPSIEK